MIEARIDGQLPVPLSIQPETGTTSNAREALARALRRLHETQRAGSSWAGTLSSSALATSVSSAALHLVDPARHAGEIARGRAWLFATQHPDGGWGDAVVDHSNINSTSIAYGALTLTAPMQVDVVERAAMAAARACLDGLGGLEAVGDRARCTLSGPARTLAALAGLLDWRTIKRLRPEIFLLPPRLRRTISTTFPAYLSISSLHAARAPHPLNALPTYGMATRGALAWLERTQGPGGSFELSAFLTSLIVMCMQALGNDDLPWLPDAIRFVLESQRADGGWPIDRDLETFDTDMTVFAFAEAGEPVPHAEAVRDWLLARQFDEPCFPTSARPGGWAWAMPDSWPECDDTSYTILALRALGLPPDAVQLRRGARWLERMQNRDGSWSTFVRRSRMPFDHDCPYITGHVISALQSVRWFDARPHVLRRALAYLAKAQRYDGTFASIWFREATAGTASVLEALADCDLAHTPLAERAREGLLRLQNEDGGWAGLHLQESTAEETSWAILALLRCRPEERTDRAVLRGVDWLVGHQHADGTWTEAPIGLYYSAMWYADSSFALTLPAQALARARRGYAAR